MTPLEAHEPTAEGLALAHLAFEVAPISFSQELHRLEPNEVMARYHCLKFRIRCRSTYDARPLFLTVRRGDSDIGTENFCTVPFFAKALPVGAAAEYELLVFDSFKLPFANMAVEMCRFEDYLKRRVSLVYLKRARKSAWLVGERNG
jgi:hypothetical protein